VYGWHSTRHISVSVSCIARTLQPICTYGIQLWGTASTSNIEILERFQSKTLRMIVDVPWYVPSTVIRSTLLHAIAYVYTQFAECASTDCY
jgi:hypothetical protein